MFGPRKLRYQLKYGMHWVLQVALVKTVKPAVVGFFKVFCTNKILAAVNLQITYLTLFFENCM